MIILTINESVHKLDRLTKIHDEVNEYLISKKIVDDNVDELLTIVHVELLKNIGRYSEEYKCPVYIHPSIYQQIKRDGDTAVIMTINGVEIKISLEIDLTQPWKSISWNHTNEYNLNDEPVLPQVPEEKEGGYIFIGNRLWSRESFFKFFIPA